MQHTNLRTPQGVQTAVYSARELTKLLNQQQGTTL